MAAGKRQLIVAQAALVWADDKFDADWYVETGNVAVPDAKAIQPILREGQMLAMEAEKLPEEERSKWLIEKMLKQAKPT